MALGRRRSEYGAAERAGGSRLLGAGRGRARLLMRDFALSQQGIAVAHGGMRQ